MASYKIQKRAKADGTLRYRAIVVVKEKGAVTHNESKTFSKQALAANWAKKRVNYIEENGVPNENGIPSVPILSLLDKYLADPDFGGKLKRNKLHTLTSYQQYE